MDYQLRCANLIVNGKTELIFYEPIQKNFLLFILFCPGGKMKNRSSLINNLLKLIDRHLVVFDIGCRGGFQDKWNEFRSDIDLIGFDADKSACESVEKNEGISSDQVISRALGGEKGLREFFMTKAPGCSSLFHPNLELENERPILFPDLNLINKIPIEVLTLDEYGIKNGISVIDFLKLDVQGAELEILKGAQYYLKTVRALEIEVEFNPIYKGQPLFSDVDTFLRSQGFCLWRFENLVHYGLPDNTSQFDTKEIVCFDSQSVEFRGRGGQLYWADAFYVQNEIAYKNETQDWQTALRDACITLILGFEDLTLKSIREVFERCPSGIEMELSKLKDLIIPHYLFTGDFSYIETDGIKKWIWCGNHGILPVKNLINKSTAVNIAFDVCSATGDETDLVINSPTWNETFRICGEHKHIERQILIPSQNTFEINFICNGRRFFPPNGDPRNLVFRVDNFHLEVL